MEYVPSPLPLAKNIDHISTIIILGKMKVCDFLLANTESVRGDSEENLQLHLNSMKNVRKIYNMKISAEETSHGNCKIKNMRDLN